MPRIDPHQLLSCLTVLLTPTGGILSKNEVQRLANLMTKFSKKLVSKCVYVLILKNTELPLLGAFMVEGGWNLVHVWLQDGYNNKNWALVSELLELLLMSPTTVEQLKTNNLPKLVKSLSKRDDLEKVKDLANQLVQKWLKIVKEDQNQNAQTAVIERTQMQVQQAVNAVNGATASVVVPHPIQVVEVPSVQVEQDGGAADEKATVVESMQQCEEKDPLALSPPASNQQACYKLAVRDGKHILCKVPPSEANVTVVENAIIEDITPSEQVSEKSATERTDEISDKKEKVENKDPVESEKKREKSNHDRHKSKSSSSGSSRSSSSSARSSKDKDRKSGNSSSGSGSSSSSRDKSRDKSSKSSSSSKSSKDSRDSSKDKSRGDKDKHRSNGSLKSSSRDNDKTVKKESKEKQAEKDKDTLTKIQPQTLHKLGRIPKKSSEEQKEKEEKKEEGTSKKPSFSIEVRKTSEEKPKTVKVFNAKMRSTGLLEEAKPPPPRPVKKTPPATLPPIPPPKRPSPIRDLIPPPEKKVKIDPVERPGAIKLIPPKPKPAVLQESDIFMDALAASASAKKEPKKRKRRMSTTKESATTTPSPPASPSVSAALANGGAPASTHQMTLRGITPANFYQDTLETTDSADDKAKEDAEKPTSEDGTSMENPPTPTDNEEKMDVSEETTSSNNQGDLKGVLVHVRKKGPKKTLKWKPEDELVEVQYFELDETERVNVSKPFGDMARMEITSEKQAMQLRKLQNDDNMGAQIPWRPLMVIDLKAPLAEPGCKSLEKDIQFAREKSFIGMSALMHRYAETPAEPDVQQYQVTDPVIIPLEDPENADQEAPSQPWPEPKGSPPHVPIPNMPPMFPNIQAPPYQNFGGPPPPPFQNVPFNAAPNFGPPPPNMMGPNIVVPPTGNPHDQWNNPMNNPMTMVNPMNNPMANGPPMMPPDMMNQVPPMFPPKHPEGFNQNMNEFPPHFNQPNMFPQQNNFNMRGRGGYRGTRGGNGPWVRMNGPGPGWNHRGGGGGINRSGGRLCKHVKNFGYCRNRDTCTFFHPN